MVDGLVACSLHPVLLIPVPALSGGVHCWPEWWMEQWRWRVDGRTNPPLWLVPATLSLAASDGIQRRRDKPVVGGRQSVAGFVTPAVVDTIAVGGDLA